MPGTKQGDNAPPPPRHALDKGYRAHNCNVYPQRPDRCYLAYIDADPLWRPLWEQPAFESVRRRILGQKD